MQGSSKDLDDFNLDRAPRQHRTKISASRLTGRLPTSLQSRSARTSVVDLPMDGAGESSGTASRPTSLHGHDGLASKINAWIEAEKHRRSKRRSKRSHRHKKRKSQEVHEDEGERSDASSDDSVALDALQDILSGVSISKRPSISKGLSLGGRKPSRTKLRRPSTTSDTEVTETEDLVPTCDVILDNTKVSAATTEPGGTEDDDGVRRPSIVRASSAYQKDAWKSFKYEIVRLTHTLRMRGWRRVPMQMSSEIEVHRLSGALTNAVYEVLPPSELPAMNIDTVDGTSSSHPKSKPQ